MEQLIVHSQIKNFSVDFTSGFDFLEQLQTITPSKIIVGKNVYQLYKKEIFSHFPKEDIIVCDFIEEKKTMYTVMHIYQQLLQVSARKNLTIISFGGGVNHDVVGFVASTIYRGINWIFVPTTLLAMADSSIGLKTSLNFESYKNVIGSFYPPSKVYIDPGFLSTLDTKDYYSGVGEIIKLLLMKKDSRNYIDAIQGKIGLLKKRNNPDGITQVIQDALEVKLNYMEGDEFDTGRRNLLNYGHELGHALESTSTFLIPHGIAVMIGMIFANIVSVQRGLLDTHTCNLINHKLLLANVPRDVIDLRKDFFDYPSLLDAMGKDKKRISTDLPLVLPDKEFQLVKVNDFTKEELHDTLNHLTQQLSI